MFIIIIVRNIFDIIVEDIFFFLFSISWHISLWILVEIIFKAMIIDLVSLNDFIGLMKMVIRRIIQPLLKKNVDGSKIENKLFIIFI